MYICERQQSSGDTAKSSAAKYLESLSTALIASMGLLALLMILYSCYLIPKGFFTGDTAAMYCVFERPAGNPYITALPYLFDYFTSLKPNTVFLRYFRFTVSLCLSSLTIVVFLFWARRGGAFYLTRLQTFVVTTLGVLGGTLFPLQFIIWPFYQHDIVLWCSYIIIILFFVESLCATFFVTLPCFIFAGILSGLDFFANPPTGVALLLIVIFFVFVNFKPSKKCIIPLVYFLVGICSFIIFYFSKIQDFHSWKNMVTYGLQRVVALKISSGEQGRFTTSVLSMVARYATDLSTAIMQPFIAINKYSSFLSTALSLSAFASLALTFCSSLNHKFKFLHQKQTRQVTTLGTISSIAAMALINYSFIYMFVAHTKETVEFANYTPDVDYLLLLSVVILCFSKNIRDQTQKPHKNPHQFRQYLILSFVIFFSAQAGSSQHLQYHAFEYVFMFILFAGYLTGTAPRPHQGLNRLIFISIFAPITIFFVAAFYQQLFSFYGGISNSFEYNFCLPESQRTSNLQVDSGTYGLIASLSKLLHDKTNYRDKDLFFAYNNLSAEVYLLGGYPLLYEHTFNLQFINSSYYVESAKKLHGAALQDAFILINSNQTDMLIDFFKKLEINFPDGYVLLGEVNNYMTSPTMDHRELLRLYAPLRRVSGS